MATADRLQPGTVLVYVDTDGRHHEQFVRVASRNLIWFQDGSMADRALLDDHRLYRPEDP